MRKIRKMCIIWLAANLIILLPIRTHAQEKIMEELDFTEVEQMLDETLDEDISFSDMVSELIEGKLPLNADTVIEMAKKAFLSEIQQNISSMVYVLLLAVLSALLTNFTKVFEQSKTADIGFYIVYLLLLAVLLQSFRTVHGVAGQVLGQMTEFMKLLMPTYMLTIAASGGGTTAAVFYEFLIALIYGVSFVLFRLILPLCSIYVVLSLVNYISREDMLSKTAELVKTVVQWGLKTMLTVVVGLNIVQGILTPAVDSFRSSTIHKAVSAVPGIGGTMNAVTEAIVGSGMLIKNGVGVGILILLVIISLVPLLKMVVFLLLYKVTGAIIQPISDKRMLDCINAVGEGARLLLKCVTTSLVLFFLTVAILTVSTSI